MCSSQIVNVYSIYHERTMPSTSSSLSVVLQQFCHASERGAMLHPKIKMRKAVTSHKKSSSFIMGFLVKSSLLFSDTF